MFGVGLEHRPSTLSLGTNYTTHLDKNELFLRRKVSKGLVFPLPKFEEEAETADENRG